MPRLTTKTAVLGAIAAAAAIALPAGRQTPGANAATTAPAPANAAVLLSTPVIVNTGPGVGYEMYIRTPYPLNNGSDTQPDVLVTVRVTAIGASGNTHIGSATASFPAAAGGYCTRIDMLSKRVANPNVPPRVVVAQFSSQGLKQRVYVRLQKNHDSKATATVPAAQSGCTNGRYLAGPG